ncbi:MAG: putative permease [Halothiobacillaceae bacterium]|nr:MAG: putative permease [Halothiobacillaceae bacterium]
MSSKSNNPILPIAALLIATTLWGTFWYPLRWLESNGLPGLWATLIIYSATALLAVPLLWRQWHEVTHHYRLLLVLGLASAWCNVTFMLAVIDGNIVRVLLLFYLSPLWTLLLSQWLLREAISRASILYLGVAMSGAMVMLWDPVVGWPLPHDESDWLAISSGFAFALSNVLTRKGEAISIVSKTTVVWLGAVVLAAIWLLLKGSTWPTVGYDVIGGAMVIGLVGVVAMTVAVLYGVSHLPAHRSAVILLFELIVGALSAQLLTEEIVTPREWLGGALIMLAAWLTVRRA